LKLKEQEFVDKLIENDGNRTKTAREVFGIADPKYAHVKAERILQKPEVALAIEQKRATLIEALEKKGVSPEKIAEKVGVLLEAKRKVFKNNNESGEIELVAEEPDYNAIDKGISHAIKIHGIEDDTPKPQATTTYNLIFSGPVQEKVKVIDAEIKEMLTKTDDQEN
jgi:phage terminase small subunit